MASPGRTNEQTTRRPAPLRGEVAIVGMACLYPKAPDLAALWENIVAGVDAVTEMPPERIPPSFVDPEATGSNRTYCRRGGFLGEAGVPFDPLKLGIMPVLLEGGDPEQFLAFKAAESALRDAGFDPSQLDGERTEVIIGRGNYANRAGSSISHHVGVVDEVLEILKAHRPDQSEAELAAVREELLASLPRLTPDVASLLVPNLTSGRVANRFDFMGVNFTVDAACASSLIALDVGVRDLITDRCDVALVGGVFLISDLTPIAVLTQINALSRRSEIRPFDRQADGTIMGEGVGIVILKRLEDARQAGDRIYAVVKGVGTSSDGRALGLLAPRVEGEELALRRAYEMAGVDPSTIGLIEAHGTATSVGDAAEIEALTRVFGTRDPDSAPSCALGTIKSMIGHALPAAGVAGLIKAALALHHKILPPTIHCEEPNPKLELDRTPFYVNTVARPWIHGSAEHPRRAGVSAFGFGGINAHVVLDEYRDEAEDQRPSLLTRWPTEVVLLEASDQTGLLQRAHELRDYLAAGSEIDLKDLAFTLNTGLRGAPERLALVVESVEDLRAKLERACNVLASPACTTIQAGNGVYYVSEPLARRGKVALLFPGFGPQYLGMLGDLCQHFPIVRQIFDLADGVGAVDFVFPPPWPNEQERAERRLWSTASSAFSAAVAANVALHALFLRLGLQPDALVGHSGGEFNACLAAGVFADFRSLLGQLSNLWKLYEGREDTVPRAGLLAVGAGAADALACLQEVADHVSVGMDNCPHQSVLAGPLDIIERAREQLLAAGILCERLPFDRPYHTPLYEPFLGPIRESFEQLPMQQPAVPVYSCASADLYPSDPSALRALLVDAWCRPVRFRETIGKMYGDGVRVFVELGPGGSLAAFVGDILREQPHLAICADSRRHHGITQLNHVVAVLSAHGVSLSLDELYARRSPRLLDLSEHPAPRRETATPSMLPLTPVRLHLEPRADQSPAAIPKLTQPADRPPAGAAPPPQSPDSSEDLPQNGQHSSFPVQEKAASNGAPGPEIRSAGAAAGQAGPANAAASGPMLAYLQVMDQAYQGMQQAYLQTMERFLSVEQSVMQVLLGAAGPTNDGPAQALHLDQLSPGNGTPGRLSTSQELVQAAPPPPGSSAQQGAAAAGEGGRAELGEASYPLLGTVRRHVAGQELYAERSLSLETDPFLFDHTFGGTISVDPGLRPLAVLPTTVSMEVMAEAAAALMPGLQVVGMQRIRSSSWINVTERPTLLRITAKRLPGDNLPRQVEVEIRSSEVGAESGAEDDRPAAQGIVLLAPGYDPAPRTTSPSLEDCWSCDLSPVRFYEWLFHGPQFQNVRALHRFAADGLTADLEVLPLNQFIGARRSEGLILDPVVLDGAGQLSAAWLLAASLAGRIAEGGLIFPVQIDEVMFYGPRLQPPAVLPTQLRLLGIDHRRVRANMEISGPDGRVHVQIKGWQHYRVHCPPNRMIGCRDTKSALSGEVWDVATAALPVHGGYVASLVDGLCEKGSIMMDQAAAYLVLSAAERETWRSLKGPIHRRAQWLLGRSAAKDAARVYLAQQYGLQLYPADIEVVADASGRPRLQGAWAAEIPTLPAVSLAHTGVIGVAVVGGDGPDDCLGIDVERIAPRDPAFLDMAFTPRERAWLEPLEEAARWEWATRFWCAKEAAAKAIGRGLVDGPTAISIEAIDWPSGRLELALGTPAESRPELSDATILVSTAREGDLIVATTVCERAKQHG